MSSFVSIHPSILSADFGHLAQEAQRLEKAGADGVHIDVMDGHFVPNLTLGPRAVAAIRRSTSLFLDVHIMIYHPYDFVESFVRAGADRITFHFEATEDVKETLQFIRRCNKQAGLAFSPETSFSMVPEYLAHCDAVLLMTVSPGFGGQAFMPEVLEKIRLTREACTRQGLSAPQDSSRPFLIQVDGGIQPETAKMCVEAGANELVSGHFLFTQPDLSQAIRELKSCQ